MFVALAVTALLGWLVAAFLGWLAWVEMAASQRRREALLVARNAVEELERLASCSPLELRCDVARMFVVVDEAIADPDDAAPLPAGARSMAPRKVSPLTWVAYGVAAGLGRLPVWARLMVGPVALAVVVVAIVTLIA